MSVTVSANERLNRDPTQTTVLRRRYAQRLRGWFRKLNAVIRSGVIQRDVFSINESDPLPSPVFGFPRDSEKVDEFMGWLREQEDRGALRIITRNGNTYIQDAYGRGVEYADKELRKQGITVPEQTLEQVFNLPIHDETLQFLYSRNFAELNGITEVMNQRISRELADGFRAGESPYRIARRITDSVDDIGIRRSTTLARTEVIRAHSEATLNRFEAMGVGEVTVKAEWATAGDDQVCPICQALEGRTFTIEEARSGTFTFNDSQFAIRPPAHPNCRCAFLPVVQRAS